MVGTFEAKKWVLPALIVLGLGATAAGQVLHRVTRYPACSRFTRPDRDGCYLAREDIAPPTPPVDGDDLLALVNRSPRWTLGPDYAPRDLVDIRTLRPMAPEQCVPPVHQCLRREAALALRRMTAAMRRAGHPPWIDSTFRGYGVQCATFAKWAYGERQGFCHAVRASALPGHSQHQLGTAVDIFTLAWVRGGPRFRDGFGCTAGGRWLAEHAWEYGFVLPYPLHPDYRLPGSDCASRPEAIGKIDPRTGYKYEPWHLRYIGVDNAARFRLAWLASGPGTAAEITLEQWLRARRSLIDPVEPPVCDGCSCGACATFQASTSASGSGPCQARALVLGPDGNPVAPDRLPSLIDAEAVRDNGVVRVRVTVEVPDNTLTQPPVITATSGVRYDPGASYQRLVVMPGGVVHAYPSLPGTWRVGVGTTAELQWRAALVSEERDGEANGINARIPADGGRIQVTIPIEGLAPVVRLMVALVGENETVGMRVVPVQ